MTRARKGRDSRAAFVQNDAVCETMRLYHAWIGYLLTRLGERTVRVRVENIRDAMDQFNCSVSREEDAYVIRLDGGGPCREGEEALNDGSDREREHNGE